MLYPSDGGRFDSIRWQRVRLSSFYLYSDEGKEGYVFDFEEKVRATLSASGRPQDSEDSARTVVWKRPEAQLGVGCWAQHRKGLSQLSNISACEIDAAWVSPSLFKGVRGVSLAATPSACVEIIRVAFFSRCRRYRCCHRRRFRM